MRILTATALLLAIAIAGCGYEAPLPDGTLAPSGIDGVWVAGEIRPAKQGFVVEGEVENRRGSALVLQPDACGHALVAVLQHTSQRPEGRRWASPSVQALKDFVLARQIKEDQRREVALTAAAPCEPRSAPVTLAPGQELHQRWTVKRSALLDEFGIVHAKVVVRVTEPGDRFPSGAQGPLLGIVEWPARRPRTSPAEHFDRLLDDPRLYDLIAGEPSEAWTSATLDVEGTRVTLTARSRDHDRPFVATADGDAVTISGPSAPSRPGGSQDLPWS